MRLPAFTPPHSAFAARQQGLSLIELVMVIMVMGIALTAILQVFFQATKANFGKIFAPENETAGQVLAALEKVMSDDATLAPYAKA